MKIKQNKTKKQKETKKTKRDMKSSEPCDLTFSFTSVLSPQAAGSTTTQQKPVGCRGMAVPPNSLLPGTSKGWNFFRSSLHF